MDINSPDGDQKREIDLWKMQKHTYTKQTHKSSLEYKHDKWPKETKSSRNDE